jgi:hypothetical protein
MEQFAAVVVEIGYTYGVPTGFEGYQFFPGTGAVGAIIIHDQLVV